MSLDVRAGKAIHRRGNEMVGEDTLVKKKNLLLTLILGLLVLIGGCAAVQGNRGSEDALREHIRALEERLRVLESDQASIGGVLNQTRAAVAYIRGTYTFVDATGRPLRHVLNDVGEPIADPEGVPLVDVTGTGDIAVTNYCGTAFLAGRQGELLTNRHVAEPWWKDETSAPLIAAGLRPVFLRLRAFFQERAEAAPIEVLRVHPEQDVALVRTVAWLPTARPLPLYADSEQLEEGQPVILVGYPTGLEAILARLGHAERAKLEAETGGWGWAMVSRLAQNHQLRPTVTGGHLWEVLPNTLVYDARTAAGGSGGPLLDHRGRVVGVNSEYLPDFHGGNYAVPIRYGAQLLAGEGLEANDARRETQDLVSGPFSAQATCREQMAKQIRK